MGMNKDGIFKLPTFNIRQDLNAISTSWTLFSAVQNERQPRNTATLRPENLMALDSERILREAVGAFG